ncbi:unnamed protein product [Mytilus edulis]|uniref:Endonuclease/exonuclease/phosphatase domain-containing protein n=1 Tax=Mytilus edulis TaxID=6550 RepID=A0A8S3RGI5_MYTED|nr:unnamed protein product [Mytilus edulis]
MGTETWLLPSICSAEIFPPNYEVIRKDRKDGYGGVLLAIKKEYISDSIETTTTSEAVFAKLNLGKNLSLIIGSVYRPPSSDTNYMDQLCETIEHVHQSNKNSVLWIGGDLNLPDINWNSTSIQGNKVNSGINKRLLDMIHNCHMEQTVTFPTRLDNTLDLFLTNRPSLINRCSPLPGISDHDAVFIETSAAAKRGKPVKRKIHHGKEQIMKN